jgi:predicted 3-demethylubiquinone-9 3-methyltransferase (glyoxalase superfamily)
MKTKKSKPKTSSQKTKSVPKQKTASARPPAASPKIQLITPFLWFDKDAENAANFYCSIFPNSKITKITRNGEAGAGPVGSVLVVEFLLNGQQFYAMNAGSGNEFTDAISLLVHARTQEELDYYWSKLTAGGKEVACGWLKDKFGLSWQITPITLLKMISDPNRKKADRAMKAMMDMVKLDIKKLETAFEG